MHLPTMKEYDTKSFLRWGAHTHECGSRAKLPNPYDNCHAGASIPQAHLL